MSSHTLYLNDALYQYLLNHSLKEAPLLQELRAETSSLPSHEMQISAEQGQLMQLLVSLINAEKAIEIGVYTGYSSLSIALALPPKGKLISCDISDKWRSMAEKYWQRALVLPKIDFRIADASQTLTELIDQNHAGTFDFAFIDADKVNYDNYYEKCLILLRKNGLMIIDNVLWDGKVVRPQIQDESTIAIDRLNKKIQQDDRVFISMLPIGDGITLIRKK